MWIEKLTVCHCRLLNEVTVNFSPDLNIIYGDNASGKSSILESLSLLSSGKSFRTPHINTLISHGKTSVLVSALLKHGNSPLQVNSHSSSLPSSHIGIEKYTGKTRIRINQKDIFSQAELSRYLPITIIHPESIELLAGSPTHRRAFIDWMTFYLYPDFYEKWKEYKHILKQRNLCLKNEKHRYGLARWTEELVRLQPLITQYRKSAIKYFQAELKAVADKLLFDKNIQIVFESGLPSDLKLEQSSLLEFYKKKETTDIKLKRTSSGVHRADMKILIDSKPAIDSASRGQLKLLTITMLLAQSMTINKDNDDKGIIIIDDLAAELDTNNKVILIEYLSQLKQQLIITTTKKLHIKQIPSKVFHVKHGVFSEV